MPTVQLFQEYGGKHEEIYALILTFCQAVVICVGKVMINILYAKAMQQDIFCWKIKSQKKYMEYKELLSRRNNEKSCLCILIISWKQVRDKKVKLNRYQSKVYYKERDVVYDFYQF